MERTEIATSLGPIPVWSPPGVLASDKPVLLTVTGAFASADTMSKLPSVIGAAYDVVLMRHPGNGVPDLAETSLAAWARATSELVSAAFPNRAVVAFGLGLGGLIALGVRAPEVRRIVAVEPLLATGKLWPLVGGLRRLLRAHPERRSLVAEVFGVSEGAVADRRHHALLDGCPVPVDVLVGETPLGSPRPLEGAPSLVDEPERAWLRARPEVTLRIAAGAGHNVPLEAPMALKAVLLQALLNATRPAPVAPWRYDGRLLAATPLTARRILCLTDDPAAFAEAHRGRNPQAEVAREDRGRFDAVVVEDLPRRLRAEPGLLDRVCGALAEHGWLIASLDEAQALECARRLEAQGLRVQHDAEEPRLLRAAKPAPAARPVPPLRLQVVAFAPTLMDIRTRLPARAMQSEPMLEVRYQAPPLELPDLPLETPKALVLQRPRMVEPELWRAALAPAIARGWVAVMEYDDHPELVAEVRGRTLAEPDWLRFGYPHAVQTSTPRLAEVFGRYNPEVKVFPNAVFELLPFPDFGRPMRVFYGGVTRGPFAVEVARALAPAIEAFPETEFLVVGDRAVFEALPAAAKRFYDYLPYEGYLELMSACAVSLSPLQARLHIDTKSDAKFLDASRCGALTIASPTVYAEVIEDGVNGLIAREMDDWPRLLKVALGDSQARGRMARRAWEYARDERMFAHQTADRRDWYMSLWARREALARGAMARLPGLAEAVDAARR